MGNKVSYTFVLVDKFSSIARAVGAQMDATRRKVAKIGTAGALAGKAVAGGFAAMRAGAVALAATVAPLLAAFTGLAGILKFFTAGMEFQEALANLSVETGAVGKDLDLLKERALRLSKATNTAAADVLKAMEAVEDARPDIRVTSEAFTELTRVGLLLGKALGVETETAVKTLTISMNQFGAGTEDATRFSQILAASATGAAGADGLGSLSSSLLRIGLTAKRSGLSFAQTNAALTVLAEKGKKGTFAARNFATVLQKLEKTGTRTLRPSVVGVNAALTNLARLVEKNPRILQAFGGAASDVAEILAKNVGRIDELARGFETSDALQQQLSARLGTLREKLRGLGLSITNSMIRVFERLSPQIEQLVTRFTEFLDKLKPEQVERFGNMLAGVLENAVKIAGFIANPGAALFGGPGALAAGAGGPTGEAAAFGRMGDLVRSTASRIDFNARIEATGAVVKSTKTRTSGDVAGLNTGVAMEGGL